MHFKINLTMVSILVIVLYFNIPFYNNWLQSNLLSPQMSIPEQAKHIDDEERRVARYGYSYLVYKDIIKAYESAKIADAVVLMPPDAYLKQQKVADFTVVEPCIFYYFTAHKAVWYDSPGVEKANCALTPGNNRKVVLRKLQDKTDLDKLLALYKTYKLDL